MTPLYFSSPLASAIYGVVIVGWVTSELLVFVRTVAAVGPRAHMAAYRGQDRMSGPVLIGGVLLSIAVGSSLAQKVPSAAMTYGRAAIFALGLIVAVAGIVVRWYAIVTLGRFFTMRVQTIAGQKVVESGPYRLVRHPSYTGALLTLLGALLLSTNWLTLACFLLALPGVGYRIYVEERALVRELGESYSTYMRRTKRLVPFLV